MGSAGSTCGNSDVREDVNLQAFCSPGRTVAFAQLQRCPVIYGLQSFEGQCSSDRVPMDAATKVVGDAQVPLQLAVLLAARGWGSASRDWSMRRSGDPFVTGRSSISTGLRISCLPRHCRHHASRDTRLCYHSRTNSRPYGLVKRFRVRPQTHAIGRKDVYHTCSL